MNAFIVESSTNRRSFFKLPLIFITVFFVIYFGMMHTIFFIVNKTPHEIFLQNLIYSVLSILFVLFLFFVVAVFYCQKYRLHSVNDSRNKIVLIAIIAALLYAGWRLSFGFVFYFVVMLLSDMIYMSDIEFWVTFLTIALNIVGYLLFIVILNFLFNLFTSKDISLREVFKLEGEMGSRVYSHIYSFLMLFLLVFFVSYGLAQALRTQSNSLDIADIKTITMVVAITLVTLLVYYITFYFSTRHSFKRIEPTAKLAKLNSTVFITYLFLFIASLVIASVLFLCDKQFWPVDLSLIHTLPSESFIGAGLINLVLVCILSRRAVKIMYG